MIKLTRLDKSRSQIVISCDIIETIEAIPDTMLTLTTGKKIMVQETIDEIIEKVVEYRRRIIPLVIGNETKGEMSA